MKIKTVLLQEMVSRAIKGASQNKLLPLTSMMSIELQDGTLRLTTTDGSNYLYIRQDNCEGEFYATVQVEQFSKLIAKMTSETVSLTVEDAILTVTGNGTYKIELPLDENGALIKFPDPLCKTLSRNIAEIKLATIKSILSTNKAALAIQDPKNYPYTSYYVGEKVITTDMNTICQLDAEVFEKPVLLAPETINLLDVMTAPTITVSKPVDVADPILIFSTDDCVVYGYEAEGLEDFAIDAINSVLEEELDGACKIKRDMMLSVLDRIALFVSDYDENIITITFTEDGLEISSKQSNGVEVLPYVENSKFKPYTCQLNISLLERQIKANEADVIELQYGNDRSFKLVDGNVTQIVAFVEE